MGLCTIENSTEKINFQCKAIITFRIYGFCQLIREVTGKKSMKKTAIQKKIEQRWQALTIRQKIMTYTGMVFLCIFLSVIFNVWVVFYSLGDLNHILEDSSKNSVLVQAIEEESRLFEQYMKGSTDHTRQLLQEAMKKTEETVCDLPFDFSQIGENRYAQTWSVRNCYEVYVEKRDAVLEMPGEGSLYVERLYEVYDIQEYLQEYAKELMNDTLAEGNSLYMEKLPGILAVPAIIALFAAVIFLFMVNLSKIMNRTIVSPVMELASSAKRIADNDFFIEDIQVESRDELGELVHAFNKMKYATGEYIMALEEKRKTLDLLHEEELEKLEVERRLEEMKLEVLKNQINPHFLFNTLNVIGGMAMLENAETTEKMIMALSNLFRYNLKNSDAEAMLSQELNVVKDYMYIQKMRFGERMTYHIKCEVEENTVIVPTFTFQPIVENAIIHGLTPKEEGGKIFVRIWKKQDNVMITIHDTGVGMSKQKVEELNRTLREGDYSHSGIGIGNVYRRFKIMYPESSFEIYSREHRGTLIKLTIPGTGREALSGKERDE